MASGFLVLAGNGTQIPPLACSSPTSRPPSVATSGRAPASASAAATSTVVRSAPPASSAGMICSTVTPASGEVSESCTGPPDRLPAFIASPEAGQSLGSGSWDKDRPRGFTVR